MQTFLPYPSFEESARVLDWRRLGKQRVESRQILGVLARLANGDHKVGWSNHPAVRMWRGHENALRMYSNVIIEEWVRRGYKNTMEIMDHGPVVLPGWVGDEGFHASHRSNLLRKDSEWYGQFGWSEPETMEYVWPR